MTRVDCRISGLPIQDKRRNNLSISVRVEYSRLTNTVSVRGLEGCLLNISGLSSNFPISLICDSLFITGIGIPVRLMWGIRVVWKEREWKEVRWCVCL